MDTFPIATSTPKKSGDVSDEESAASWTPERTPSSALAWTSTDDSRISWGSSLTSAADWTPDVTLVNDYESPVSSGRNNTASKRVRDQPKRLASMREGNDYAFV